jgi:large subunit ribosomal protein L18
MRVRKKVRGSAERPRLSVFRSLKHIHVQLIDDVAGRTLCAVSSAEPSLRQAHARGNRASAEAVGKLLAERARAKGIAKVVFDRGGYLYHGRVKALAEGSRAGGLEF